MNTQIRNCRECGRIFEYFVGPQVCQECRTKNEKKFLEVRDYIYDHEDTSISTVAEACDISERQLRQWVREERLELKSASISGVTCEICGKAITSGRYCEKCKAQTLRELKEISKSGYAVQPKEDTDKAKMRYFNRK